MKTVLAHNVSVYCQGSIDGAVPKDELICLYEQKQHKNIPTIIFFYYIILGESNTTG